MRSAKDANGNRSRERKLLTLTSEHPHGEQLVTNQRGLERERKSRKVEALHMRLPLLLVRRVLKAPLLLLLRLSPEELPPQLLRIPT